MVRQVLPGNWEGPQDLNLEVGWSYNVCSIFRVFFSAGRKKSRKIFFEILILVRVGRGDLACEQAPQDLNLEVGGGSHNVCLIFWVFGWLDGKKLRKILLEILISGKVGRGGLAWKLAPQDLNLEVGGSHNVCSIFHISVGRTKKN